MRNRFPQHLAGHLKEWKVLIPGKHFVNWDKHHVDLLEAGDALRRGGFDETCERKSTRHVSRAKNRASKKKKGGGEKEEKGNGCSLGNREGSLVVEAHEGKDTSQERY